MAHIRDRTYCEQKTAKQKMAWTPQAFTGGGGRTKAGRRRVCFQLQFNPAELDEYLEEHKRVWPEMQAALVECGWHNYSLFYRPDGYAIGYFETDGTFETACQRMDARSINTKWQSKMSRYTASGQVPLVGAAELSHYFYLGEDMLADEQGQGAQAGSSTTTLISTAMAALQSPGWRLTVVFAAGLTCGFALACARSTLNR